ncbi:MAG: hypothetical protein HZB10_01490 [Candidatus Yonathbacteria bacterium]|nr:hypothetical protein [Candidatus Yonathbacteria bacterium]
MVIITSLLVGGTYYFWHGVSQSGENRSVVVKDKFENTEILNNAIVTEGTMMSDSVRKQTHFSIYRTDGTLIKKIALPRDASRLAVGSNGVFGKKIYYLSGSPETTSIAEIDPLTGISQILSFTKTETTNPGNVLFAIIAWTVSDDNTMVAWIDTSTTLHIANRDGSEHKRYPIVDNYRSVGGWVDFSRDGSYLYVWRGDNRFLLERLDIKRGSFDAIVKSENRDFMISPSGRYLAYSNWDTSLTIRDLTTVNDIRVSLPETYDGWYGGGFSPDESELYFTAFIRDGKADGYFISMNDNKLSRIKDRRLDAPLVSLFERSAITRCRGGTCLVDLSTTNKPLKISGEWFIGTILMPRLNGIQ